MTDFEAARQTMVLTQLLPSQVTDRRLLAAFGTVPRERFVPEAKRTLAYRDGAQGVWPAIDGAPARYLLAPVVLARLIQLAAVEAGDAVLDIGCATGYSTAVLAQLARSVTGVEPEPELAAAASATFRVLGIANATIVEAALPQGAPAGARYDVILLNGSVAEVPQTLLAQLQEGGRLVAIVGDGRPGRPRQPKAYRFVKVEGEVSPGEVSGVPHFDANAAPLPGFAPAPCFTF
jgi:protein-L-isoaspartate(D-aspartate) O-methyltransferase